MARPLRPYVQGELSKDSRVPAHPIHRSKSYKHLLLRKLCNWVPSNLYEFLLLITTVVWLVVVLKTQQIPFGLMELWIVLAVASKREGLNSLTQLLTTSLLDRLHGSKVSKKVDRTNRGR